MKVTGYSERGVLNSLVYEIAYSGQAERLLADLLATAHFPGQGVLPITISDAEILVEQSLSDFGDADAILLLRTLSGPMAVFVEAKVSPSQARPWLIAQEFKDFWHGTQSKVGSSNLFTQMYHKVRFANALRRGKSELEEGVPFPKSSSKPTRKIGNNPVVRRAAQKTAEYVERAYFLALVPEDPGLVSHFFERVLPNRKPEDYEEWDTSCYGHLSWHEVEAFCTKHGLTRTLGVLEFNHGQIY